MKPTQEQLAELSRLYNERRKCLLHYKALQTDVRERLKPDYDKLKKIQDDILKPEENNIKYLNERILKLRVEINLKTGWVRFKLTSDLI